MTRRRTVWVAVLATAAVVLLLALVVGAVRSVLPSSDEARAGAQEAAQRLVPGRLRVLSATWRGEAGGYNVVAELADPRTTIVWVGDKACAPGSVCEERLRVELATVLDGTAEHDAVVRAFSACGLSPVRVRDVSYEPTAMLVGRRELLAALTVVVPAADLDGAARPRTAERLDACALAWAAGRPGLLPVTSAGATLELAGADGRVHSTAGVVVEDGHVRRSGGDGIVPVVDTSAGSAFRAAVDGPVRAFLRERGVTVRRIEGVECTYAAGTTRRLDLEVTVSQVGGDPMASLPSRRVLLAVDADGGNPTGLRLVP